MQKYLKIPLWFFFIAACIGLLLRWHFISPLNGLIYPYWLHAHSHMMFLGWVLNVLYLAYVLEFIPQEKHTRYRTLFIIIQALLVGMLISFPLQGYGLFSIIFSTLHTFAIGLFCWWFIRDTAQRERSIPLHYARYSLIFFLISAAGPFSLGPLMANGLGQSHWYYFAIYFYLHFQYNGVFVSGVLSLVHGILERKGVAINQALAIRSLNLLFVGTILSYALSVLWAQPHWGFNVIGLAGSLLQLASLIFLVRSIGFRKSAIASLFQPASRVLFLFGGLAFVLKTVLQCISAHPDIARLAYDVRPFVISYIHLVVIGVVTFSLIAWYFEKGFVHMSITWAILLTTGFFGSEAVMIFGSTPVHIPVLWSSWLLFVFSVCMTLSIGWLISKMK